ISISLPNPPEFHPKCRCKLSVGVTFVKLKIGFGAQNAFTGAGLRRIKDVLLFFARRVAVKNGIPAATPTRAGVDARRPPRRAAQALPQGGVAHAARTADPRGDLRPERR